LGAICRKNIRPTEGLPAILGQDTHQVSVCLASPGCVVPGSSACCRLICGLRDAGLAGGLADLVAYTLTLKPKVV